MQTASVTVHIAFATWFLFALGLFVFAPPRRAVVAAFVLGSLFLPNAGYRFPGLHTKSQIISAGVLLCTLIFHAKGWWRLRLRLFDLPMIVWCLCPFASALANGFGTYDALSAVLQHTLEWGIPYFIARVYFTEVGGLRDLAVGVLIGGIVYIPLCWWEIRMSPQLHTQIYGFYPHQFAQAVRYGGFRPTVFMNHGLAVAMWMAAATLQGFWLWRTGALKRLWIVPLGWFLPLLFLTTLLCKSANAIILLMLGCLVYFLTKNLRTAIPILCLVTIPLLYMVLRTTGSWSGATLLTLAERVTDEERAWSLQVRLDNETTLLDKALQKKVLGWSRWGRSRVYDEAGKDVSVADEIWVIAFGENGLVGLIAFTLSILMPVLVLLRRCPSRFWAHRNTAPAAALAVLLTLHMIDNLFNAMTNPIFMLAAGALVGLKKERIALALKPWLSSTRFRLLQSQPLPGQQ